MNIYVDRRARLIRRWSWEAREGGWHVDFGRAWTRRGAVRAAHAALLQDEPDTPHPWNDYDRPEELCESEPRKVEWE